MLAPLAAGFPKPAAPFCFPQILFLAIIFARNLAT
jgi:hypothetical protein